MDTSHSVNSSGKFFLKNTDYSEIVLWGIGNRPPTGNHYPFESWKLPTLQPNALVLRHLVNMNQGKCLLLPEGRHIGLHAVRCQWKWQGVWFPMSPSPNSVHMFNGSDTRSLMSSYCKSNRHTQRHSKEKPKSSHATVDKRPCLLSKQGVTFRISQRFTIMLLVCCF